MACVCACVDRAARIGREGGVRRRDSRVMGWVLGIMPRRGRACRVHCAALKRHLTTA